MAGLAPFALADAGVDRRWQRAGGAALVILLHLLLLLAALRAVIQPAGKLRPEREMTLILPRLLRPPARQEQTQPAARAPSSRAIVFPPPLTVAPPLAPSATPDIKSLGQSLFGCAPENLADLSPAQRARCGASGVVPPDRNAVTEPRSHVKNPELRAAEMEKKNTPMNVPCTSIQTQSLGNTAQQQVLMIDPVCAVRELNK